MSAATFNRVKKGGIDARSGRGCFKGEILNDRGDRSRENAVTLLNNVEILTESSNMVALGPPEARDPMVKSSIENDTQKSARVEACENVNTFWYLLNFTFSTSLAPAEKPQP